MNDMRPDHSEEQLADYTDNLVPTRGYQMLPVVGLGGSAGGLDALRGFFSAMPPNPGLAFVVVMHLSAEHDSVLAEVLQRCTPMRVLQVQQTEKVEPDTVYVIPPGKSLRTFDGYLQLGDLPKERSATLQSTSSFAPWRTPMARTLPPSCCRGPMATARWASSASRNAVA